MPQISYETAKARILTGPIGVGEDHEKPAARNFVLMLMRVKRVRALLLEERDHCQTGLDSVIRDRNNPQYKASLYGHVCQLDSQHLNDVKLSTLVARAGRLRVPVHLVDAKGGTGPYDLQKRDRNVAAHFTKIKDSRASDIGMVLLFGAEHFIGSESTYGAHGQCLRHLLRHLDYVLLNE
jgi:hypothetical protein